MQFKSFAAVIILLYSLTDTAYSTRRRGKPDTDGIYDCCRQQMCECKKISRWVECWETLEPVTKHWFFGELNKCEMGVTIDMDTPFPTAVDEMCSVPGDIFKPCYERLNGEYKEYLKKAHDNPERQAETAKIEQARVCMGTNIMECSHFGTDC